MGVELQDLLKAGVHFGHQTHRWNPKMRKYIFAECGGIYLIDLKKTQRELERAHELVRQTIVGGKSVLFVCTKPQLARVVRGEAERCGSFYVTERWLGGMLTNFQTIKKNIARLKELERGVEEGAFEFYTKKERLLLERSARSSTGICPASRRCRGCRGSCSSWIRPARTSRCARRTASASRSSRSRTRMRIPTS